MEGQPDSIHIIVKESVPQECRACHDFEDHADDDCRLNAFIIHVRTPIGTGIYAWTEVLVTRGQLKRLRALDDTKRIAFLAALKQVVTNVG